MALDFTTIKDEPGTAVFLMHDGSTMGERYMTDLAEDIRRRTKKQIILLDGSETVGRSVLEFYGLATGRYVLLVRDDDQLHQVWREGDNFDAAQIAYLAEQAG